LRKKIAVIGGGAAGFFATLNVDNINEIHLFEKSPKLLSKVRISGGGRCNLTNSGINPERLIECYPRGYKELRQAFSIFSNKDTIKWFESFGINLKTEDDCRVFPSSESSDTIIDFFLDYAKRRNVFIHKESEVKSISKDNKVFRININNDGYIYNFDSVLVSTGGSGKTGGYNFLNHTGHKIINPVPSLFTFNSDNELLYQLEGVSLKEITLSLLKKDNNYLKKNYKIKSDVLITHKGISGPAVLLLSAYAARELSELNYNFNLRIDFLNNKDYDFEISLIKNLSPSKTVHNSPLFDISARLWKKICLISGINEKIKWNNFSNINKKELLQNLISYNINIQGKSANKEEFVTSGGIPLNEIDINTMQSKILPGLFFAGEVLNIDGITGGFNFQSAWTTAFIAAKGINSL